MKKPARYYKQLAIEFWEYLRDHPEIEDKIVAKDFPRFKEIFHMKHNCPCCELYFYLDENDCPRCPLSSPGIYCCQLGQPYSNWGLAKNDDQRAQAAQALLDQLAKWRVR